MTKNHVSMEDLLAMAPADLGALTVDQLLLIQQEIVDEVTRIKNIKTIYDSILIKKYDASMAKAYIAKNDAYGKVSFKDDEQSDYIVDVETPKNVKWDPAAMKAGEDTIRDDWEEDPEEYITLKRSIPEATFNAWPKAIQKVFSPARSISAGKRKISIKLEEKE
tara:strand:- start:15722 stop:16213 length:492 start_codon:yes stop_codon:yes gene_type:complete